MRNTQLTGFFLVILSAVAFGAMPVLARLVYADGVDPISLLFVRFVTAGLLMLVLLRLRGQTLPRGRGLVGAAGMGAVGYFGQSLCYFTALTLAPASLVALLLYLYPALVAVLAVMFLKEQLSYPKAGALLLALSGAVLVVAPIGGSVSGSSEMPTQPLGIFLAFSAAVIYAVYIVAGSRVLKSAAPVPTSVVIMFSAAASFGGLILVRAASGEPAVRFPTSTVGWTALFGLAAISTVIAITGFLAGMERIGPTNASLVSTLEPLISVGLAAAILGEQITPARVGGGVLILAAVVMLALREKGAAGKHEPLTETSSQKPG